MSGSISGTRREVIDSFSVILSVACGRVVSPAYTDTDEPSASLDYRSTYAVWRTIAVRPNPVVGVLCNFDSKSFPDWTALAW